MNRARRGEVHVPLKLTRRSWGAAHLGEGVDGTKDLRHELQSNVSARPCEGDLGPYLRGQVHTETLRDAVTDEVAIDRLASEVRGGRVREALSLAHKSVQLPHQLFKTLTSKFAWAISTKTWSWSARVSTPTVSGAKASR